MDSFDHQLRLFVVSCKGPLQKGLMKVTQGPPQQEELRATCSFLQPYEVLGKTRNAQNLTIARMAAGREP